MPSHWCGWRLPAALIGKFSRANAGVRRARSAEEGIQGTGGNVTLNLPLFDRCRGPIEMGCASRACRYQSYQTRLDETRPADQAWIGVEMTRGRRKAPAARLCGLERAAAAAKESLERAIFAYLGDLRSHFNALADQAEELGLLASLKQTQAVRVMGLALPR